MTSKPVRSLTGWGVSRFLPAALLVVLAVALSSASSGRGPLKKPDKLVILSTTDVKGKTGPCG